MHNTVPAPVPAKSRRHYSHLAPEERITIASLLQQGLPVSHIATTLGRSTSTISREVARNKDPASTSHPYNSDTACRLCIQRRKHSRPLPKLHPERPLFDVVCHFLRLHWSPMQIALTLAKCYPRGHHCRVSHESIYTCIYAQPVGSLKKELVAALRHASNKRVPRSRGQDRRGQIPDMVSIHLRPPEVEGRQLPGHWEGDLIKGTHNASAVGTLVERTSRVLILVKLPHPRPASAANVLQAFTDKLLSIAAPMRKTLTYDQGREMALHRQLAAKTGMGVYFCDPHSPWQRGSNENINGLVRQYLPKGTDLSVYSQEDLDAIADEINTRPRQGLGMNTPLATYRHLLASLSSSPQTLH